MSKGRKEGRKEQCTKMGIGDPRLSDACSRFPGNERGCSSLSYLPRRAAWDSHISLVAQCSAELRKDPATLKHAHRHTVVRATCAMIKTKHRSGGGG